MSISALQGETLVRIHVSADNDEMTFYTESGRTFLMHHVPDCCECVDIEDICGDLDDLIGSPITVAEEVSDQAIQTTRLLDTNMKKTEEDQESFTWTFYKIDTAKGGVTIRWFGASNGYYSESVNFDEISRLPRTSQ